MKLQEIFDQLSYGELSQLSIGGLEAGVINESNYERLLVHINLGLAALYKRFNLKEGTLVLELQPGLDTYNLNSNFAVSNTRSREPVKYIIDSASDPFKDDLLKVEAVIPVLPDNYTTLSLNDLADINTVATTSTNVLRVPKIMVDGSVDVPYLLTAKFLKIKYRASHPKIAVAMGYFDPTRVEVELPYAYLEPLLYFVASRINNPIGMTNEFHAGNSYAAKYEVACQELERANLQIDAGAQFDRNRRGGWV